MGVNIIRSPGRIDTFQHLLFFTKLRFEPQILAKIGLKSTSGNSLNPKLCQLLTITDSNNANKMWYLSQIEAFFLRLVAHPRASSCATLCGGGVHSPKNQAS
ncbi:hypothetical protein K732_19202 [Salmonella enterica subsp. enterica serovar Saintpaul str. S-70]|nr:hypothetical protein K732_19202 [Salmonella enterica subsp. enterica serovar Saintpaul str. S-70]